MKKLMFALAVAVATGMANAAALSWSIQGIKDSDGKTAGVGNAIMLFVSDYTGAKTGLKTTTASSVSELLKAGKIADAAALNNGVSKTVGANGVIAGLTGLDGFAKDETISVFAVVFNDEVAADATAFAVLDPTKNPWTWTNNASPVMVTFGDVSSQTAAAKWQSIPEPTSGLLLLLGVAGLALRRRRA